MAVVAQDFRDRMRGEGMNFFLDVAAAGATLMAAIAAFLAIRVQRQNAQVALSLRLVQELREEFDGEVMRANRKEAARWLLSVRRASPDDGQTSLNPGVAAILSFFERVGLLIEREALDEYLLWFELRSPVNNYGSAIRNVDEKLGGQRHRFYRRAHALFRRFDDIERNERELSGVSQNLDIAYVDSLLLDPWLEREAQQDTG